MSCFWVKFSLFLVQKSSFKNGKLDHFFDTQVTRDALKETCWNWHTMCNFIFVNNICHFNWSLSLSYQTMLWQSHIISNVTVKLYQPLGCLFKSCSLCFLNEIHDQALWYLLKLHGHLILGEKHRLRDFYSSGGCLVKYIFIYTRLNIPW